MDYSWLYRAILLQLPVAAALGVVGWWVLKNAATNYVKKFAEESAHLDARLVRIDSLIEEARKVTTAIESVKQELSNEYWRSQFWTTQRSTFYIDGVSTLSNFLVSIDELVAETELLTQSPQLVKLLSTTKIGSRDWTKCSGNLLNSSG